MRGTANLPAGLGKTIKTAVLCSKEEWEELEEKGVKVDFRIKEEDFKQVILGKYSWKKDQLTLKSYLPLRLIFRS